MGKKLNGNEHRNWRDEQWSDNLAHTKINKTMGKCKLYRVTTVRKESEFEIVDHQLKTPQAIRKIAQGG